MGGGECGRNVRSVGTALTAASVRYCTGRIGKPYRRPDDKSKDHGRSIHIHKYLDITLIVVEHTLRKSH